MRRQEHRQRHRWRADGLLSEGESLRTQLRDREGAGLGELVGTSPIMQRLFKDVRQVASSKAPVLFKSFEITAAASGEAGLAALESNGHFEAVVSDMPEELSAARAGAQ